MADDRRLRVLMVDDEEEFLEATARALSRRGFNVDRARDGRAALALVAAEDYDAFVLDVKMPGIGGVELFRRIQIMRPDTPVVMLTGHGSVQQAFETSRAGLAEYLTKPCEIEQLAAALRRVISEASLASDPDLAESCDGIRLLLVDDEEDFVTAMARALGRRGMRVADARDGVEALELADRQVFDVAVIDVRMPGMDGLELLRLLKSAQPLLEVLVLTGHPSMSAAVEAVREGAFDFLTKPQEVDQLAQGIAKARRLRELHEARQRDAEVKKIIERNPS